MILAYDGTAFQGWQAQPRTDTIQGRLETALGRMAKAPVSVVGSGRTDAGVHALAQVAHFRLEHPIPTGGLVKGVNTMLPPEIRVRDVSEAPDGFHARYSATAKTYAYRLDRDPVPLPFRSRFSLHYPHSLDLTAMNEAASCFEGEHDFRALRASACGAKTTTRRIFSSRFTSGSDEPSTDGELVYEVTANGFLHHMVRNLVGTLLEVGAGKRDPASMLTLLDSGDRTLAGPTAPAKGLHLMRVDYS